MYIVTFTNYYRTAQYINTKYNITINVFNLFCGISKQLQWTLQVINKTGRA